MKDWVAKLGVGLVLSMATWLANYHWKRIAHGRRLVNDARPKLEPLGTSAAVTTGAGYLRIRLKNIGTGTAQGLCLAMSHCSTEACGGQIQAGEEGQTEELYYGDQPVYQERKEGLLNIIVSYLDRFKNLYKTIIPFSQVRRDDGKFIPDPIHWDKYVLESPKLSIYEFWKIGK